ncbi:MAG: paraquat-inducible protein B [Methyloprofundus sp.]|nr:MAG: paraquat-inducible protein B [Methyloprofundus sp.]
MSEPKQDDYFASLPESDIQSRSKLSIIWLVPLVALLTGAWIAYQAWSKMGPTITIAFKTADGLEAGKTKIKYKNVEIGQVTSIHLNHVTKNVEVIAEMSKDFKPFLSDQTRFWVVNARIDVSGVSGLETLLSGAYIGVDPSSSGKKMRQFTGLDIPPVVTRSTPGKHFILHTKDLGSIARDAPIYYRKFNVGQVENVKLNEDGKSVAIQIFVREPFDKWVYANSKFWNASGVDFEMSAQGISMNTESLVSILMGGIAFHSNEASRSASPATNNAEFKLYDNQEATLNINYKVGPQYIINFSESVRGLSIGAPVEFSGIQLGEVTDIQLRFDDDKKKFIVPVTMTVNYDRLDHKLISSEFEQYSTAHKERTNLLIKQGLRARLQTGNLLTGQLFIELDFFPHKKTYEIDWDAYTPEFPSVPGALGIIKHDIPNIIRKIDDMMTEVKELSYKLNHTVVPEISKTLQQTNKSLATIETTLQSNSPLQQDLHSTLREVNRAARSFKDLTDYLERHPESLLNGKEETIDE